MTKKKKPNKISKPQATPDDLNKAFLNGLAKDFNIQDLQALQTFWRNIQISLDFSYDDYEKGDDLLDIAQRLEEITDILAFSNHLNSVRLGSVAPQMVEALEGFRETCIEKHRPAKNHAPTARQMDAAMAHIGDYLINVLGIPFRYHASVNTKRENMAIKFIKRIGEHLELIGDVDTRGLDAAANKYRKKLNQGRKRPKIKLKKKPLKSAR